MKRRTFRLRLAAAAGATAVLSATGLVAAAPAALAAAAIPTVTVHVTAKNITFAGGGATTSHGVTTLHAGRIHFHVTTGSGDHALQILRFHNGYTPQQAQQDFQSAFNGDVPAIDRIDRGVVFRGGAEAKPHLPGDMVVTLAKGQFMALDQNGNAGAVLQVV